jgi:hypothetical protein
LPASECPDNLQRKIVQTSSNVVTRTLPLLAVEIDKISDPEILAGQQRIPVEKVSIASNRL